MSFQLLSDNIYWDRFCYCLFIFRFHKQNSQPSLWSVVWCREAYYISSHFSTSSRLSPTSSMKVNDNNITLLYNCNYKIWKTYHSYVSTTAFCNDILNAESALHSCMKYYIKRALNTRKCFVALPIFLLIHIGIDVDISTGIAKYRAIVVVYTANLPAHALLDNMKSFTGEYSYSICTDRGQYTSGTMVTLFILCGQSTCLHHSVQMKVSEWILDILLVLEKQ